MSHSPVFGQVAGPIAPLIQDDYGARGPVLLLENTNDDDDDDDDDDYDDDDDIDDDDDDFDEFLISIF